MARPLRIGLAATGIVLAVALAGAGVFALTFDPDTLKPRMVDAVRRATGRELVLGGKLRLILGPAPGIEAEDVSFANRAGGSQPAMASVARVAARLALLPLLTGRIEIARLTLVRPDILLETDDQGVGNWQVQRQPGPMTPGQAAPRGRREPMAIREVDVEGGRVRWRDGRTGRSETVDLPRASVTADADATHLVADATIRGTPMHLDATGGAAAQLMGAVAGPFPVKLAANAAGATLAVEGAAHMPLTLDSFQGRITAGIAELAGLGPLLHRALPPLHDVRLDLTLGADRTVQAASLHAGASDLSGYQPGLALAHAELAYQAGQPARLEAEGSLATRPWRLVTGLVGRGTGVALRGLDLRSPVADLQGDVAVALGERPVLRGTLVAQRVDLDQFRGLAAPLAPAAPVVAAVPAPIPAPRAISSPAPLPWRLLRLMDFDLQLAIDALHVGGADYRAASTHLALHDGALRLDPLSVQAPEGRVDGWLTVDATQPQPAVAMALRTAAFALDPLARGFGLPGGSDAIVEVDAALQSAGASPHELAAHLDGHVGLASVDGEIANAALAAAIGPALRASLGSFTAGLDPAGRSHVRCLALRLDAAQGLVTIAALKLDTARLTLEGTGTIDLGAETMALRLRPTVRVGGAGVMAPVRLDGALAHPAVALDAPSQAGRLGLVIGGPPGQQDACAAELAAARDGRAGRLPAEVATKPGKPIDLLRSFLR